GEFAFEHGAFASDNAVILSCFAIEERRKNVRQENLFRSFEITLGAIETLCHHAELSVRGAEDVAHLPQHFVHANIGTSISRAVVASKEQTQLFSRLPARATTEHPFQARQLNQRANPHHEKKIGHVPTLPVALFAAALSAGQGLAG